MTQLQSSIIWKESDFMWVSKWVLIVWNHSNSVVSDGFVQIILWDDISPLALRETNNAEENSDKLIITWVEWLKMTIWDTILWVKCNLKQIIEDAISWKNPSLYE